MDARTPHYLRFARTLALATTLVLPACTDDSTDEGADQANTTATTTGTGAATATTASTGTTTTDTTTTTTTTTDTATATDTTTTTASDVDAGKISGPLPPPEMPASLV